MFNIEKKNHKYLFLFQHLTGHELMGRMLQPLIVSYFVIYLRHVEINFWLSPNAVNECHWQRGSLNLKTTSPHRMCGQSVFLKSRKHISCSLLKLIKTQLLWKLVDNGRYIKLYIQGIIGLLMEEDINLFMRPFDAGILWQMFREKCTYVGTAFVGMWFSITTK